MYFKFLKRLLVCLFFFSSVSYSQKTYNIDISSGGNPVEFPYVYIKNNGIVKYGNKKGQITINTTSNNDTIMIECNGYIPKEIALKNQPNKLFIELEQSTEFLKEITITINNNEKSRWQKVNKRTKKSYETNYYGLVEGYNIISSYRIDSEIKFNGIRFFITTNTLRKELTFNKNIRPILIINSEKSDDNILPNKVISLNKEVDVFTKLDIEFENTVHLLPDEILTIGLELIPEDLTNPNIHNIMGVLTTKHLLKESKTFLVNLFSKTGPEQLNEDIYFELKIVK